MVCYNATLQWYAVMERVSYAHVKFSQTPITEEGDRKEQKKTRFWQRDNSFEHRQ